MGLSRKYSFSLDETWSVKYQNFSEMQNYGNTAEYINDHIVQPFCTSIFIANFSTE
jgi:hypothetical protein